MKDYIEIVNKNVDIKEGITLLEQFLLTVYFESPISNKVLARKLLLPVPLISAIKKEFIKLGLFIQHRGMTITEKGKAYAEKTFGLKSINKELYVKLCQDDVDLEDLLYKYLDILEEILNNRPVVDRALDQAHCTYLTSFFRSVLTVDYRCLLNKKILCLGDDDLVSISIGLLLKHLYGDISHNKTEIHVVDMDKRYLSYIETMAEKHQLPIKCHQMDLREPLDEQFKHQFDCFFTDPPYTLNGLELFLSRGISALKKIKGLPVFLSFAHKSFDESYEMLKKFYEMGLCLNQIIPSFNEYEGAAIIGNIGQLEVLYTTSKTKATIRGDQGFIRNLYTREVKYNLRI